MQKIRFVFSELKVEMKYTFIFFVSFLWLIHFITFPNLGWTGQQRPSAAKRIGKKKQQTFLQPVTFLYMFLIFILEKMSFLYSN